MLSFKRLKSCAAYALSYIVRAVSVSVGLPFRLFLAIATYFGVGMISGSEKPENVGTNDNFKTMDSHESDSDDESFTCEYDSTWEEEDVYPSVDRKVTPSYLVSWKFCASSFFSVELIGNL